MSEKDTLLSLYWEPDRSKSKKQLEYEILKNTPYGTGTGGIAQITWGTVGGLPANPTRAVVMQLKTVSGANYAEAVTVRLTASNLATLSLTGGGVGTVVSGSGTNDMLIETSATGAFSLTVTDGDAHALDPWVLGGATQGSAPMDCRTGLNVDFTP